MLKFLELDEKKHPVTSFDTTYPSLDTLDNAGLLLNNKVVVVDFDKVTMFDIINLKFYISNM